MREYYKFNLLSSAIPSSRSFLNLPLGNSRLGAVLQARLGFHLKCVGYRPSPTPSVFAVSDV